MTGTRKTAGVLGGMGPDATVDFMARVIAMTPASRDQDHIPMLVDNNPKVPNRQVALLSGGENPGEELAMMGRRLEQAGADFLVIVCNSAHAFLGPLRESVSIPLASIIDISVAAIPSDASTVGVMATDGCLASGLFQTAIESASMEVVLPEGEDLVELMALINGIKAGEQGDAVAARMAAVAKGLEERGAGAIIAGCTEIPLVLGDDALGVPLISSTDELARETVAIGLGEKPLPA